MIDRRRFLQSVGAGLAVVASTVMSGNRIAVAQTYPSRPITLIVPFAAGGGVDAIARVITERMRVSLGQPVIIENVAGAAGSIGVGRVARAVPDGYTLDIAGWGQHVANGVVYALKYDLLNDFEPVALVTSSPLVIFAAKNMPANDLMGLIAWLKVNPDKASTGIVGVGSISYVADVFFQRQTGTRFQLVPYRTTLPMQDLVAGQPDFLIDLAATAVPMVHAGTIKAYAGAAKIRLAAAPDIPTVDEAGLPGFYMTAWQAIFAPKGTSAAAWPVAARAQQASAPV